MPLLCTPFLPTPAITPPAISPSRQLFGFLDMTNIKSSEAAQHHLIPKPSGATCPSPCSAPCCGMAWQRDTNWDALDAAAQTLWCSWGEGGSLPPAWRVLCPRDPRTSLGGCPPPSPISVLTGGASSALPHKHGEGALRWLRVSSSPLLPSPWRNLRLVLRTPGGAGKMI